MYCICTQQLLEHHARKEKDARLRVMMVLHENDEVAKSRMALLAAKMEEQARRWNALGEEKRQQAETHVALQAEKESKMRTIKEEMQAKGMEQIREIQERQKMVKKISLVCTTYLHWCGQSLHVCLFNYCIPRLYSIFNAKK